MPVLNTQHKVAAEQTEIALDGLTDVDTTTTSPVNGDVLTFDGGDSTWKPAAPSGGGGGGLEMNVYRLMNGSGTFSGTLINNWGVVDRRDEGATELWGNFDSYAGSFECLVTGVYEIVVECEIVGSDSFGNGGAWPEGLTAYGADMQADYPALHVLGQTKTHTRYSNDPFPNLNGNFGMSQLSAPVGDVGTKSTFTERFIVRSDTGGLVYPKLFAASYNNSSPTVNCSMTISFMKVSGYSPA